jgi:DNA-binding GntR family transcriptional regulator
MTRRITVSLPDDVAEYLDKHPNSSAIVTKAVRDRMERAATTRAMLEAAGFKLPPEGQAWARSVLRPLTEEQRAETERVHKLIEAGRWEEI